MQILKKDLKHGIISVKVTDLEDLWHLSHIVSKTDVVEGVTERKIKVGNEENAKVVRKTVRLVLEAEKIEYEPENDALRILGIIKEGPDDVSLGSHHSFNVSEKDIITITKNKWAKHELKRLEEAETPKVVSLLVLFDREEALLAFLTRKGYQKIAEIKGDVQKKADDEKKKTNFYKEICEKILETEKRTAINNIILASPAFWKEYLLAELPEILKKKTITATISGVNETAISELMKRPELNKVLENQRTAQEHKEIEELMKSIREEKAFYGLEDAKNKIVIGGAEKILVTENFLKKIKEKNEYEEIDSLLMTAEDMGAEVVIISDDEQSKRLDNLGGIAGRTRWTS
jgi:protein pelota